MRYGAVIARSSEVNAPIANNNVIDVHFWTVFCTQAIYSIVCLFADEIANRTLISTSKSSDSDINIIIIIIIIIIFIDLYNIRF